jgi:hypothetical protein
MCLSVSPVNVHLTVKYLPSLEVHGKGAYHPCSPKWDLYGKRRQFPEPFLTYPSHIDSTNSSANVQTIQETLIFLTKLHKMKERETRHISNC